MLKDEIIGFRIEPEVKQKLMVVAENKKISLSELCRKALEEKADEIQVISDNRIFDEESY